MLRFNFPKYISTPDIEGGGEEKNAEDANLLARAKMWTGSIRNGVDGAAAKKTKQKKRLTLGYDPKSSTSELTVWVTARPLEQ